MNSKFLIFFTILFLTLNAAYAEDLAETVKNQQEMIEDLKSEIDYMKIENAEGSGFFDKVDIHGFISQGYLKSSDNNFYAKTSDGSAQFNELGLSFSSEIGDNARIGIQLISRDLGNIDQNKVKIDWAFADYSFEDWLGVRVGKVKSPVGLYSETRDLDMLRTPIFLPIISAYDESTTELFNSLHGVSFYGSIPVLGTINYTLQYGISEFNEESGGFNRIWKISSLPTDVTSMDSDDAFVFNLNWETPLSGLKLASTYAVYNLNCNIDLSPVGAYVLQLPIGTNVYWESQDNTSILYSLEYTLADFVFTAEYHNVKWDNQIHTNYSSESEYTSWYAMMSYRFNDRFAMSIAYSEYEDDKDPDGIYQPLRGNPTFASYFEDLFVSARFDLSDTWILKFEVHSTDGTLPLITSEYDQELEQEDTLFAVKTTVSF